MNGEIISIADVEPGEQPIHFFFDERLHESLNSHKPFIVLCLRPDMMCCIDTLDWLEVWNRRVLLSKKELIIVSANDVQFECLEVSHPEMGLHYAATLEMASDYWMEYFAHNYQATTARVQTSVDKPVVEESAGVSGERGGSLHFDNSALKPASHEKTTPFALQENPKDEVVVTHKAPLTTIEVLAVPDILMAMGTTVKTTGEYVCVKCGSARMWLRGDSAVACDNPECKKPESGWKLTFELF